MRSERTYSDSYATYAKTSACPDPDEIVAFLEGTLVGGEQAMFETHIDGCASCFELLSALLSSGDESVEEADEAGPVITRHIGPYTLLSTLGVGAMGTVYEARDLATGERVALKVAHPRAGDGHGPSMIAEAEALASVCHPCVVKLRAPVCRVRVGDGAERECFAMELVEGRDLGAVLAERSAQLSELLELFIAIGRALAATHRAGVVHGDVKPANIRVDIDGQPRLLDFGLARHAGARRDGRPALVGTPMYMAPEQLGGQLGDARSDQFAFCVMLFRALCGRQPFAGRNIEQLRAAVRSGAFTWDGVREEAPLLLRALIARGMSLEPDRRWPDMSSLIRALVAISASLRLSSRARRSLPSTALTRSRGSRAPRHARPRSRAPGASPRERQTNSRARAVRGEFRRPYLPVLNRGIREASARAVIYGYDYAADDDELRGTPDEHDYVALPASFERLPKR